MMLVYIYEMFSYLKKIEGGKDGVREAGRVKSLELTTKTFLVLSRPARWYVCATFTAKYDIITHQ